MGLNNFNFREVVLFGAEFWEGYLGVDNRFEMLDFIKIKNTIVN